MSIGDSFIDLYKKNNWYNNNKTYDLCINYYQDNSDSINFLHNKSDYFFNYKGFYLHNFYNILKCNHFWKKYDFIMKTDDDLEVNYDNVNKLFKIISKNISLSQPRITGYSNWKYFSKEFNNLINDAVFIEIQTPVFRIDILHKVYNIIGEYLSYNLLSGFGIDIYWSSIILSKKIININFKHTKQTDINKSLTKLYKIYPWKEAYTYLNKKKIYLNEVNMLLYTIRNSNIKNISSFLLKYPNYGK
jgi:hypothetical protein